MTSPSCSSGTETPLLADLGRKRIEKMLIYSSKLRFFQFSFSQDRLKIGVSGPEPCSAGTERIPVRRCSQRLECERGSILVLGIFLIVALLAVAGLAVDAGNLYRARIWAQKAADAGALAGVGYTILTPRATLNAELALAPGSSQKEKLKYVIETRAAQIASANMNIGSHGFLKLATGGPLAVPNYDIDPADDNPADPTYRTLTLRVAAPVFYFIMPFVPFKILGASKTSKFSIISAMARTQRSVANIGLILDISNSMACPSEITGQDCTCLSPNRTGPCAVPRKVDRLVVAVNAFLDKFEEGFDRVSLSTFNIAANVPVSMDWDISNAGPDGFNRARMTTALAAINPVSNTNICDGLLRSYNDIRNAGIPSGDDISYVLFSDGAPTAGRFLVSGTSAKSTLDVHDPYSYGARDYTHYSVQWVNPLGSNPSDYSGPSFLVKTGSIPLGYNAPQPPIAATAYPACVGAATLSSDPANFPNMLNICLNDLGFVDPFSITLYGENIPFTDWRKQYYHCAVEYSDFLRRQRGLVYVVGLGPEAAKTVAQSIAAGDPYQNIDDNFGRKDIFLSRLANHFDYAITQSQLAYGGSHPQFSFTNSTTYDGWNNLSVRRQGSYASTPSDLELENIFTRIAAQILLRLMR